MGWGWGCGSEASDAFGGSGAGAAGGGPGGSGGQHTGGSAGTGGNGCPSGVYCGPNSECCAQDEECVEDECLPVCPPPRVRCGAEHECCATDDICFSHACTTPGQPCVDFADCEEDEYCEPTLGLCLPMATLPECEYHPPAGVFAPDVEWTFGPTTAPYIRDRGSAAFVDICAGFGTPVSFADADESVATVSLSGMTVPFFEANRGEMTISTNGWLTFQSGYSGGAAPDNTDLPDAAEPNLLVAPYWDDLDNVSACTLLDLSNQQVVVQWSGEVKGTAEVVSFQAVMKATGSASAGDIELIYGELGASQDGDGATVGLEDPATGRAIVHSVDRDGGVSLGYTVLYRYLPLRNHFDALTPPAVFDLDFDSRPEVILSAYDEDNSSWSTMPGQYPTGLFGGILTILNGEDGTVQARIETSDGYLTAGCALSVGDIDGDDEPEIVGVGRMNPGSGYPYVKAFEPDGSLKWVSDAHVGYDFNGWGGGVHIADLDGDGAPEIFFGLRVYNNQGQLLWAEPQEYAYPTTTAADLDGDGDLELVSDRRAWHHDQTMMWQHSHGGYHFPSVADFDLDGSPEVALVGGSSVVIVAGTDGSTLWGPIPLGTSGGGPLNIGDFDADGFPEIGTAGAGQYVVIDLQCTGDPLPDDCESEWIRWTTPSKDHSSEVTGSSLFDFDGDGTAEVVYSDECFTRVYSGFDGTVLFERPNNTRTATEFPLVADVDGDNNAETVIVANEYIIGCTSPPWNEGLLGTPWEDAGYPSPFCGSGLCAFRGLTVYGDTLDNWVRTRRIWSGHGYHITNINGNGTIPGSESPNWLSYNNYRMNAQGVGMFNAPDLVVELAVDESSCPDQLGLEATVENAGALGVVAGVKVSFFESDGGGGWDCLGTKLTSVDLLPGGSTVVSYPYPVAPGQLDTVLDFRVLVDADCEGEGDHNECETGGEDNNEALGSGECTGSPT